MRVFKVNKAKVFLANLMMVIMLLSCSQLAQANMGAPPPPPIVQSGDYKYAVINNEIMISSYVGNDENVVIPSTLVGLPVTSMSTVVFSNNTTLKSVSIPQGIRMVYRGIFYGCTNLTSVEFDSATTIIEDMPDTIPNGVIIGHPISTAKDYATEWHKTFKNIGEDFEAPSYVTRLKSIYDNTNGFYASDREYSLDTSMEIAKQFVKENGKLNNLVIASGENWPDALSGGPLAVAVNSPLIMVPKGLIGVRVFDFIRDNVNPDATIYILGGPSVVDMNYDDILTINGYKAIKRLYGQDRIDTSVAVANEIATLKPIKGVCIVGSSNYVDAVSIASYASKEGLPILITDMDTTKGSVTDFMKNHANTIKDTYIVGGTGVVGSNVEPVVSNALTNGSNVKRLWGSDRYDTNGAVGTALRQDPNRLAVVSNDDYISALSGAVYAGHHNMFLMIVPSDNLLAEGNKVALKSMGFKKQDITVFGKIKCLGQLIDNLQ